MKPKNAKVVPVIELLQQQAILSLFQVKVIERNSKEVIQIVKARDFIEQYGKSKMAKKQSFGSIRLIRITPAGSSCFKNNIV